MIRCISALALLLAAGCDLPWAPSANDNARAGWLDCPPGEVEWTCYLLLGNVTPPHRTQKVVCADGDPTARARIKKAFPSACDIRCTPTEATPHNDARAGDTCEALPLEPACGTVGATCDVAWPCCAGLACVATLTCEAP